MITTIIDGKIYDITDFVNTHPGGREMIRLAENRDSTYLFWSYHINRNKANKYLSQLHCLGNVNSFEEEKYLSPSLLFSLQDRVLEFVNNTNQKKRGGGNTISRILFFNVTSFLLTYLVCFCGHWWLSLLLGISLASFGLCVQHSANHGSLTDNNTWNEFFGYYNDITGASSFMWKTQHNLGHHLLPNNIVHDPDTFSNYPITRFSEKFKIKKWHNFQFLYLPLITGFMGFSYLFFDFLHFINGYYFNVRCPKKTLKDVTLFFGFKLLHVFLYYFIPMYNFGHWWTPLLTVYTGSTYLSFQFLISHNTSEINKHKKNIHEDWAEMQITESSTWCGKSKFINFITGGLNSQIEHHLFPGLSDQLYPQIQDIVIDECKKRNIVYVKYDSFYENLSSCLSYFYNINKIKN